jgi:UPF0755 protein
MLKACKITASIFFLIAAFAIFAFKDYASAINARGSNRDTRMIEIKKGDGAEKIAKNLFRAGLIKSPLYFKVFASISGLGKKFQAGEYELSGSSTIKELAVIFARGEVASKELEIRIIEGWSIQDIDDYLSKNGFADKGEFKGLASRPLSLWSFDFPRPEFLSDAPSDATLEGYLFPDTYRIFKGDKAEAIIKKMLDNFGKKISPEFKNAISQKASSLFSVITMASLIEKEVNKKDDRPIVSGIFYNRIESGQPLQSCATLAYILGEKKPQYSLEDTNVDSAYNTYRHKGLPPGPIANPGLESIRAAIDPVKTEYNYFLTSSIDGATVYAATFEEHVRNKMKYLD